MRYEIEAVQKFNGSGILGIWLFLGSPAITAIGFTMLASRSIYDQPSILAYLAIITGGFAFLGGCICLLIGRYQKIAVRVIEDKQQWPADTPRQDQAFGNAAPWPKPLGPQLKHDWGK